MQQMTFSHTPLTITPSSSSAASHHHHHHHKSMSQSQQQQQQSRRRIETIMSHLGGHSESHQSSSRHYHNCVSSATTANIAPAARLLRNRSRVQASHQQQQQQDDNETPLSHQKHSTNCNTTISHSPCLQQHMSQSAAKNSIFGVIPEAPVDPILSMTQRYKSDSFDKKVNLGVGAYRDHTGKPYVLRVVREVEKQMISDPTLNKEYIPQDGLASFYKGACKLMYGEQLVQQLGDKLAGMQSISGTGALRIGFTFLNQFKGSKTPVYLPNPTWGNHFKVLAESNMTDVRTYRYYNPSTRGLDFNGMIDDLRKAPQESIVLLHLCAHNPTGVDPTQEQWKEIYKVVKERNHIPFFDSAYQGFASGDLDRDAFAVRYFVQQGAEVFTAQSFAKNLGLYGERIGCLSVVTNSVETTTAIRSQIKTIVRAMYSSPPLHGAQIVSRVIADPKMFNLWMDDLTAMSDRIKQMRQKLYDHLVQLKTPGTWDHILKQIGMFTFTGLNAEQSNKMIDTHHIYMLTNGRISMAGLNESNVEYVARAIHSVVTGA